MKIMDSVKCILEDFPQTRDSDYDLFEVYYNFKHQLSPYTPMIRIYKLIKDRKIPSLKTLERCRRKVQELYPELQASSTIKKLRKELEEEYHNGEMFKVSTNQWR